MAESACGTLRASAHSSAMPCSAAATVLAVGALTTAGASGDRRRCVRQPGVLLVACSALLKGLQPA
jgi:hypothetical protein